MSRYACPLVSLQYSVLDPDTLKRLHKSKNQQIEMERLANKVMVMMLVVMMIMVMVVMVMIVPRTSRSRWRGSLIRWW